MKDSRKYSWLISAAGLMTLFVLLWSLLAAQPACQNSRSQTQCSVIQVSAEDFWQAFAG
ncbi:MAG: hypothetical protein LLF76_12115 [Planctomycetaceae bacterium]|nr:hypothetical protein [Planctomycetaceae bacterium]